MMMMLMMLLGNNRLLMPVQRYMYLLYLHTVHTSYMYFFAACVVPIFIAYMSILPVPPLAPSKKKNKTAPRSSTTPYVQCTTSVVSYCHAGGEEGLLWRSNMVHTHLPPCTYNRRYVACSREQQPERNPPTNGRKCMCKR